MTHAQSGASGASRIGHYSAVATQLKLIGPEPQTARHNTVLEPLSGIHRAVVRAPDNADTLSLDLRAVYVDVDPATTEQLRKRALLIEGALLFTPHTVVTSVLFHLVQ